MRQLSERGTLKKRLGVVVGAAVAAASLAVTWYSYPRPVGQLTPGDEDAIRIVIGKDTADDILEILPRENVVVVNTGKSGVCRQCYYVKRTPWGWAITWHGS